ncbi:M48 family metallopeptidase [Alphaproteobacteria bacterium LSUCC0684]
MFASIFGKTKPATEWCQFTIGGELYEVCWRRRRNARKLTMRWQNKGLQITSPHGVTAKVIENFIIENRHWIRAEKERLNHLARIPSSDLCDADGETPVIFFRGEPTTVKLMHNPGQKGKSRITVEDGNLIIHLPYESRLNPSRVLENWLKSMAKEAIQEELASILPELGEKPVQISIRDQKSRWGSCSTRRRMSFNWRLIMAPTLSLRYVVIHEAAHLHHHDHSPHFWHLVEKIMPDYRTHQHWLKQNQIALFTDINTRLLKLTPEGQPTS